MFAPMMPGTSHKGMMDESTIPPGWSYSPSTWTQRLPIIMLGFFGVGIPDRALPRRLSVRTYRYGLGAEVTFDKVKVKRGQG